MSTLAFDEKRGMAKFAAMAAFKLGAKIGAVADDLRSMVARSSWQRGGHMRRLPLDVLAPALPVIGATLPYWATANRADLNAKFLLVTGTFQQRIFYELHGTMMPRHAQLWTPPAQLIIGYSVVLIVLALPALYWRGNKNIWRGCKRFSSGFWLLGTMLIGAPLLTITILALLDGSGDRALAAFTFFFVASLIGLAELRARRKSYA